MFAFTIKQLLYPCSSISSIHLSPFLLSPDFPIPFIFLSYCHFFLPSFLPLTLKQFHHPYSSIQLSFYSILPFIPDSLQLFIIYIFPLIYYQCYIGFSLIERRSLLIIFKCFHYHFANEHKQIPPQSIFSYCIPKMLIYLLQFFLLRFSFYNAGPHAE